MKKINCYNCGDNSNTFYADENGYRLVRCDSCGLLYVNPRPDDDDISQSSRTGQHKGQQLLDVTGAFSFKKKADYQKVLIDFFGNSLPDSVHSWLDIGCGHGEFLLAVREFEKREVLLKGLEPNQTKQLSGRKYNLDISNFDLANHTGHYDMISLLNVYSHLPNPSQSISDWKSLLNPYGMLLLETGDAANFPSDEQLRPFYLPDHLSFASQEIIVGILERNGFEIVSIKKYPAVRFTVARLIKEVVKVFFPNKVSTLKQLINYKKYAEVDMYILARLLF